MSKGKEKSVRFRLLDLVISADVAKFNFFDGNSTIFFRQTLFEKSIKIYSPSA